MKRVIAGLLIAALTFAHPAGTVFAAENSDTAQQKAAAAETYDYPDDWDPEDPMNARAYEQIYGNQSGVSMISTGPKNGVKTKWGSTTYTHNDYNTKGKDIIVGMDVSYHNGNINWTKVKKAGIKFAIIRVGYRGYGSSGSLNKDTKFTEYIKAAQKAGIKVGVYFFSQAISKKEAIAEANYALKLVKGYKLDLPICFDYEYAGSPGRLEKAKLSKKKKTQFAQAFCDTVEKAGYDAMIYASSNWCASELNTEELAEDYGIWMARYNTYSFNPETEAKKTSLFYDGPIDMWQCTSTAKVSGISTNVDLDYWYKEKDAASSKPEPELNQEPIVSDEPLEVVPVVQQAESTANSVRIDWTPVVGVTGYQIQYSDRRNSGFQSVDVEGENQKTYTIPDLAECGEYYVKVCSYICGEDGNVSYGKFSSLATLNTTETIGTRVKMKKAADMRKLAGTEYAKVVSVPKDAVLRVERIATDEKKAKWYRVSYTVGKKTYTGYIPKADTSECVNAVSGVKQSGSEKTSVTVEWTQVPEASGYLIYRSTAMNGKYKQIAQIKNGATVKYVNKNLTAGTEFYYKIRAYKVTGGKTIYGAYTAVQTFRTKSTEKFQIRTKKASVLRQNAGTAYKKLATVPGGTVFNVSYTTKDKSGKIWYKVNYKVKKKTYTGYLSKSDAPEYVKKVSGVKQSGSAKTSITIKWNQVTGASGYVIYRSSAPNGKYKKIAQIKKGTTVKYVNKKLAAGTEYYYKIRAYRKSGGKTIYGEYTAVKTFHTKAAKKLKVKTKASVNLRKSAGTAYKSYTVIPKGKRFTVIYKTKDKSGKTWYKVKYKVKKKTYTGYISSSYTKKV